MMIEPLTEREHEILLLISQGLSNKEIARQLYLSPGTIKAHNHNIFTKIGVSTRTQALLRARELGLLAHGSALAGRGAGPASSRTETNLPQQLTPFIGREVELARLTDLIADVRVRLVTITGAGGTGKTRLAIEAARQSTGNFSDGVFFVSLARISDLHNIVSAVMDDLGVRFQSGDRLDQQLVAHLRDKRILLVLDNFEHLLAGADFITDLLEASTGIKVLVTSRERLNLSAEVLFVLGGLDYNTGPDLAEVMASGAAQLLVQRAQLVRPDFEPHTHDFPHVRRICQLTEGMPLALILAAGWLDMLTLEEIAVELTHSIDILESQLRDLPARQRSMRSTITASWDRLTPEEQRIFASLSVFRGGFTREAALRVAGAGLRELQTLVNRSLIAAGEGRYEIHELLRQYGAEELERANQADAVRGAHSAYYLDFLRQREADVKGKRQRAALDEIQADFENIRSAWTWATQHRSYDAISQAIDCLTNFAVMRAFLVQVKSVLQQTVAALTPSAGETPHPIWDQMALRYEKSKQRLSSPCDRARLEAILERARAYDNHHEVAYCLWVLGNEALRVRDYAVHRACLEECLSIWRQLGDEFYMAHALVGICGEDMSPERSEHTIPYLRESAMLRRRLGDTHELSFSLNMIGMRLMYQGAFDESSVYFDECLALQHEADRTPDYAGILSMKGLLAFWRGDFETAARLAQGGIDFSQEMNYFGDKSACQALLGCVACMDDEYTRAHELCVQASLDKLFDAVAVVVQWGLAMACCGLDDAAARTALADCLHIARNNLKSPVFQQVCLPLAVVLAAHAGERERAVELLALALNQPPAITGWTAKWPLLNALRRDVENTLGTDAFTAAWERGRTLQLDAVVGQLLADDRFH
jgi:predicted ATPase/DNA-binding CsgD family transcriptional regulator